MGPISDAEQYRLEDSAKSILSPVSFDEFQYAA